jgi:hypothetical protein
MQLDSKEIWNKVLKSIQKNNLTVTPRNINLQLYHITNDKRHKLWDNRDFLLRVADKCLENKIKSYIKFKTLF